MPASTNSIVLIRGTYLTSREDGYVNVRVNTRLGASSVARARVGVDPALLVPDVTVWMLQEIVVGNDYVIIGVLADGAS